MERKLLREEGRLHNLISRRLCGREAGDSRVNPLQGHVMGYLHRFGERDIYQRDIERELSVRRSTVTVALNQMESEGLIVRENVEHDRRLKKITMTDKAKRINEEVVKRFESLEKRMLAGVDRRDLQTYYKVIDIMCKNLEDNKW